MATTLRDLVKQNPALLESSTPIERDIHAMLPGQDSPSEHPVEKASPTSPLLSLNPRRVRALWEAGEVSEREAREYQAFSGEQVLPNQAESLPDSGGETQLYTGVWDDGGQPDATLTQTGKRFPVIKVDS